MKQVALALAALSRKRSDGSNDPGDIQAFFDVVIAWANGEYDDDLDGLLGKPFVGTVLGVLAEVIEDWAEKQ
jgi:hypothetical protein